MSKANKDRKEYFEILNEKMLIASIGTPDGYSTFTAHDIIRKLADKSFQNMSSDLDFIREVKFCVPNINEVGVYNQNHDITLQISVRLYLVGSDDPSEWVVLSDVKDVRFTKQMVDDLSASDFISILRDEYRKLLEGLERRKQDIEKSKST